MPEGWMDEATWNSTVEADRIRMARRLFGRDGILRDIPGGAVRPDEWTEPNTNPHGYHTYPVWDRQASVEERADKIMMENPGVYSPEQAVDLAEREVPQYSRSEQRQVAMADYFREQGYDADTARERANMEEEDAWRRRQHAAAAAGRPAARPAARPAPGARGESRTSGASLPLPVDAEVPFGSYEGMPPVEPGLDPARVAEVAATMPGIPREEAWQRAQLALLRGPGRGGAPAKAAPPRASDPWAGRPVSEGLNPDKVRSLATYYVQKMRMKPNDAWARAQVDVSRDIREGTTSTSAELDSRLRGGQGSERMYPNSTVPGVNDASGVPTRVSREMGDAEAVAYNYRAPHGTDPQGQATEGGYEYSQRDRDMAARGFVPVQTPEGVHYMPSGAPKGEIPGRPGFQGNLRPDLEERGYTVKPRRDVRGNMAPVYVRTPKGAARANRTRQADWGGAQGGTPFAINQRLRHLAERAGIPVEDARKMVQDHVDASLSDDDPTNDIVMGSQESFQPLRDKGDTRYQQDKLERVQNVRRNAMMAGGQPTTGPGGTIAYTNTLSMLPQEWQNQVLANRLTGGDIGGSTPLDVQARRNEELSALGLRVATGQGFNEGAAGVEALRMRQQEATAQRDRDGRMLAAKAGRGAPTPEVARSRAARALEDAGYDPVTEIPALIGPMFAPEAMPTYPSAAASGGGGEPGMPPVRGGRIPGF